MRVQSERARTLLVFATSGDRSRRASSINAPLIHGVGISSGQCCTGSVVQAGVAGLGLGVLILGNVGVGGNFVRLRIVVVGHVERRLSLGIAEVFFDVVIVFLVKFFGVGIDLFPIRVVGIGDVQHALARFKLRRDVFHLDPAGSQLLRQEQVPVIQVRILAFFHQVG